MLIDEKEASRCAEQLLSGTYVDEEEEESKGPSPMEDIKTAPEKPMKAGGKKVQLMKRQKHSLQQ